ncbi:MAG: acetyl-CoA C-acyltransferase, partial [Candidatus Limnocylindrales bacterium]
IVGYAQAEVAPKWLFLAPIAGVRRLLERVQLDIGAFDLVEINEAFAAQVLADGRELGFDWDRVNVNGGAIALGHPIGASGARITTTLLYELRRRGGRYGLATLCLGGGGSVAMAVERA